MKIFITIFIFIFIFSTSMFGAYLGGLKFPSKDLQEYYMFTLMASALFALSYYFIPSKESNND